MVGKVSVNHTPPSCDVLNFKLFVLYCMPVCPYTCRCMWRTEVDVFNQSLPHFFWTGYVQKSLFTETSLGICLDWLASCACFYVVVGDHLNSGPYVCLGTPHPFLKTI